MGPHSTREPKRLLRANMVCASERTLSISFWLSLKRLPNIPIAGCSKEPNRPMAPGKDDWSAKGAGSFFPPPNKDLMLLPILSIKLPPPPPPPSLSCTSSPSFFFNSAFSRFSRFTSESPPKNLQAVWGFPPDRPAAVIQLGTWSEHVDFMSLPLGRKAVNHVGTIKMHSGAKRDDLLKRDEGCTMASDELKKLYYVDV